MELMSASSQAALFATLLGVSSVFHLAGMALLVARRRMFPICGREVVLVLGFALGTLASDIELCLEVLSDAISCRWRLFISVYTALLALNSLCSRLFRLWFLYFLAQERLKNYYLRGPDKENASTFFSSRRKWTTPRFLVGVFLAVVILETIALELVYLVLPDSDDCMSLETVSRVVYTLEVLTIIGVGWTAYHIRNVNDGYLIQYEIRYLVYFGALYFPFVVLHSSPSVIDSSFPVSNLVLIVIGMAFTGVTVYFPVYKSFYPATSKRRRRHADSKLSHPSRELSRSVPSLIDILTKPEFGRFAADFEDHLTKEFSIESVLFFRTAQAFEALEAESLTDQELAERAIAVWFGYLSDDAENLINISHDVREGVVAHLEERIGNFHAVKADGSVPVQPAGRIDLQMYLEAKNSVYSLMSSDPYRRWSGKYTRRPSSKNLSERAPGSPRSTHNKAGSTIMLTSIDSNIPEVKPLNGDDDDDSCSDGEGDVNRSGGGGGLEEVKRSSTASVETADTGPGEMV